jgi:hypothetical protein
MNTFNGTAMADDMDGSYKMLQGENEKEIFVPPKQFAKNAHITT